MMIYPNDGVSSNISSWWMIFKSKEVHRCVPIVLKTVDAL